MSPINKSKVDPYQDPNSISDGSISPATQALHADDHLSHNPDIAPPLHVSTNFHYSNIPDQLVPARDIDPSTDGVHVYSRATAPNSTRLETLLAALLRAPCLTYSSGVSAVHALYVFLRPKRVSIGVAYHGSHGVLGIHTKLAGTKILPLDCPATDLQKGDVIHLETPMNPTGEALNIATYAEKAHSRGAYLLVDATFGPPSLQDPFRLGADVVIHSGTKYLGGHGDLLCGVLACPREEWIRGLRGERTYLGNVMGSLEAWLGVRSLRTLDLRVRQQSKTAGTLVAWLDACIRNADSANAPLRAVLLSVHHASLQKSDMPWLSRQMPYGFGPVFALRMQTSALARRLPSTLRLFRHATSLGGVESLVEWRAMSDPEADTRLVRVSVGVEDERDLKADLERGLRALSGGKEGVERVEGLVKSKL